MKVRSQKSQELRLFYFAKPKDETLQFNNTWKLLVRVWFKPTQGIEDRVWLDGCHFLGLGKEPFERHEWWWPMAFEARRFALGFICLHACVWSVCFWVKSIIIKPLLSSRVNPRDSPTLDRFYCESSRKLITLNLINLTRSKRYCFNFFYTNNFKIIMFWIDRSNL